MNFEDFKRQVIDDFVDDYSSLVEDPVNLSAEQVAEIENALDEHEQCFELYYEDWHDDSDCPDIISCYIYQESNCATIECNVCQKVLFKVGV